MVEAYILIRPEAGKASDVAREVSTMTGVTMCEYVMGPYEVIARIQSVPGITRTTTCTIVHL